MCGKTSLEALNIAGAKAIGQKDFPQISAEIIHELPKKLLEKQTVFGETGGLHAAALFDVSGNLIDLKEDVGRHNAVDKLIGKQFLENGLPLSDKILFLSGRASFELVQKAVMANIPIICAVGAPSSLAVEAAREFNITLLGFVRDGRFNIYTGEKKNQSFQVPSPKLKITNLELELGTLELKYETTFERKFDSSAASANRGYAIARNGKCFGKNNFRHRSDRNFNLFPAYFARSEKNLRADDGQQNRNFSAHQNGGNLGEHESKSACMQRRTSAISAN